MTQIIDRRLSGKHKSAVNRQRFLRRFKAQIKKAVTEAVSGRSIRDMEKGEKVKIPTKDTKEPVFSHGLGGRREIVRPGNRDFVVGDRSPRPEGGGGGSGSANASNSGEGEDDFTFQLSREEFLEFFFEDLELPDLVKKQLAKVVEHKYVRAGYTTGGVPANLNVVRSLRGAMARHRALGRPKKDDIAALERELEEAMSDGVSEEILFELKEKIADLKKRSKAIPYLDTFDLRYNNRRKEPIPSTQAVMFCLMDVSGSMNEDRKDIAKRFFILLYLFLTRTYENIEVVFIRHHTTAKEVDEEEFFYSRETGGTVVSSALELMYKIIQERYQSSTWNIYAAQASDGDNWEGDSPECRELLIKQIMPLVQYYAYVEITASEHQGLWREYQKVAEVCADFAMRDIDGLGDIYYVFRKLFEKKERAA